MKVAQQFFDAARGWQVLGKAIAGDSAQLVLAFGERHMLESDAPYVHLGKAYPKANIVLASTAGEIAGTEVSEDRIVATALSFEKTRVRCAVTDVKDTTTRGGLGRPKVRVPMAVVEFRQVGALGTFDPRESVKDLTDGADVGSGRNPAQSRSPYCRRSNAAGRACARVKRFP
jgi:hypothetical protein